MTEELAVCIRCSRTEDQVPVLQVGFKRKTFGICSNCLPVLIHKPGELTGKLAGMEGVEPAPHTHN